jgi:hypothetical protein
MVRRALSPDAAEPIAEKNVRQRLLAPVPKLTLVGEENILRRVREPPLRNSANSVRNFGIRTASCTVFTGCVRGRSEEAWATVY